MRKSGTTREPFEGISFGRSDVRLSSWSVLDGDGTGQDATPLSFPLAFGNESTTVLGVVRLRGLVIASFVPFRQIALLNGGIRRDVGGLRESLTGFYFINLAITRPRTIYYCE